VQDDGTKEYFSHLLPELGIHNVSITTFAGWAMKILGIEEYEYIHRYGDTEEECDMYEYQKIRVLREQEMLPLHNKNPFIVLSKAYGEVSLFKKQKKENKLDRFDLTILLTSYLQKYKKIETTRIFDGVIDGVLKKRTRKTLINYSLVVVDEFQNYLPEQLVLLKACINDDTKATMYVGDTAQQVYLGTIKEWSQIGEKIPSDRSVRLDKVYRNTKNILLFIQSLGYLISIPTGIKEGPIVTEKLCLTQEEEIEHIRSMVKIYEKGSIGVLGKSKNYLEKFQQAFKDIPGVHVLTMNESQGVEFDFVCIVGIHDETFTVTQHSDVLPEHIQERKAMQRDLLYVALTRAITELHILGSKKLHEIIK
jgi:DNA helicase IV